jgi:hypothetical protein
LSQHGQNRAQQINKDEEGKRGAGGRGTGRGAGAGRGERRRNGGRERERESEKWGGGTERDEERKAMGRVRQGLTSVRVSGWVSGWESAPCSFHFDKTHERERERERERRQSEGRNWRDGIHENLERGSCGAGWEGEKKKENLCADRSYPGLEFVHVCVCVCVCVCVNIQVYICIITCV